ncbi:hypothetical protein EYC98_10575 [Halieaceae bacterium IMCC14734]|uniref:Uncharacterized protein n=1 Tax=Candidatus Litorirhabdus singularis TaxID=2518993 RepID=A0ABT3TG77_9GAMM|nr:hypothetical protein [Candidatus Litorirhabdus singularis]MCX2981308.1 hypothetical protein [Candidatus Litorirhabdus singularis]
MKSKIDQIIIGVSTLFFPSLAFSYLDPGTGSMILQSLIAVIAVSWFALKTYWYKITSFFGGKKPADLLEEDESETKQSD